MPYSLDSIRWVIAKKQLINHDIHLSVFDAHSVPKSLMEHEKVGGQWDCFQIAKKKRNKTWLKGYYIVLWIALDLL